MSIQDLFRVIYDDEEVEIKSKNGICLWYGKNKVIPEEYFEKIVNTIYSVEGPCGSCIIIEIA